MRRLKLILVFRSVPNDDIKLRELLERFGLIERFTPYVSGGRGAVRGDEAREWLTDRRNEAVAEVTLARFPTTNHEPKEPKVQLPCSLGLLNMRHQFANSSTEKTPSACALAIRPSKSRRVNA
jgi:hypothetical protein